MKILHLIYSEQVAGAERYLLSLLPGLKDLGIDCRLICITPQKDKHKFVALCDELNQKGVETLLLTGSKYAFWGLARKVNRYLRQNDIRHLHSHLFKSDLLAVIVKKFFYRKLFLLSTKHGYREQYVSNYPANKGTGEHGLYYRISKWICRNTDQQVTISRAMSDLYFELRLTKEPMHFIHHGINIPTIPVQPDPVVSAGKLVVVGRVELIKGHRYLLNALPEIIRFFPGVKLQIIGNGNEKQNLMQLAQTLGIYNHVEFSGFKEDPAPFIAASDIIVLPSLFEPFGIVFLEAFALKTPVIAFDVPAANEILVNGETGVMVPAKDSKALAARIIHLLQHPEERKRLSTNAFKCYEQQYTLSHMLKETAGWYKKVID